MVNHVEAYSVLTWVADVLLTLSQGDSVSQGDLVSQDEPFEDQPPQTPPVASPGTEPEL